MQITISGRHVEVTDAIRDYATKRLEKLPRYFDRITQIEAVLDTGDHKLKEVEVRVWAEHVDQPFVGKQTSKDEDIYACMDEVVQKLERQLTDHKERIRNRKHQKG